MLRTGGGGASWWRGKRLRPPPALTNAHLASHLGAPHPTSPLPVGRAVSSAPGAKSSPGPGGAGAPGKCHVTQKSLMTRRTSAWTAPQPISNRNSDYSRDTIAFCCRGSVRSPTRPVQVAFAAAGSERTGGPSLPFCPHASEPPHPPRMAGGVGLRARPFAKVPAPGSRTGIASPDQSDDEQTLFLAGQCHGASINCNHTSPL